jgi:glucan-binding YG repeat protein
MALLTEDTPFAKLINQAIKQGKEEFKELQATNAAVESLTSNYKEEQLSDSVTRKDYEDTKEKVDKLFEGEEKKAYLAQLATIEKALDKREAEAQELAEQQAQAAAEAAQNEASSNQTEQTEQPQAEPEAPVQEQTPTTPQTNAGSEILGPNTPKNSNNEPIISSRQSDIDDANNPAWNWAPGVYDKVINESIKRGYIVEGDFYVERVRIENGEGYYNLYATSNKSSLLKGTSESALPMYLFTINAKTGFFRGNGSN